MLTERAMSNFYYMVLKYNCDKIPAKSFFKGDEKM